MLRTVLVSLLVAATLAHDFDDGINFRVLKTNYFNKDLAGGLRFGVGYGVSYDSLEPAEVIFKRYSDGAYRSIERSELGKVELAVYEEAYCDSDHEDNDPNDGIVDDGCNPAIKGFLSVEKATCELAGRYILEYKGSTRRFNIVVRQCDTVGRYDWFEDSYWSDGETDMDFEEYYNKNAGGVFLGVNEDNFLNKGILGGFRVRVGADDDLDLAKLAVYKEGSDSLPDGMTLDKNIFKRTCDDESDSDSSDDSDDSDVEPVEKICKPAIYGFVTASPAVCSMDGDYYLQYDGRKIEFEVHVKSCGKDDWDEYESDYLYDSDAEE